MNILDLTVVGFAAFAVTFLVRYVGGPFDIFVKVRLFVDRYNFLAQLFSCFWCLGFWVGLLMLLLYISIPEIVYVFCVLGILGWMHEVLAE